MATKPKSRYSTVDEFMDLQNSMARKTLEQVRATMRKAAPAAEEVISYKMPALQFHGILAWYTARKDHYCIYARPRVLDNFKEELLPFRKTKSTLTFQYTKPVPKKIIAKLIKCSAKMNLEDKA